MVSWIGLMKLVGATLVGGLLLWLLYLYNICLALFAGGIMFILLLLAIRYFESEFQPDKP